MSPLTESRGLAIWAIFIFYFALDFTLGPHEPGYLRTNWLAALSVLVPTFAPYT